MSVTTERSSVAHVGPVDLDEVPCRVADVHLHPSGGVLVDVGVPRAGVERAELLRLDVHGLEVLDVEAEVVVRRRVRVTLEEMELLVAEAEPDHGMAELRRGDSLHPEDVLVEPRRLLEIDRVHRHVVDASCSHPDT